MAEDVKKYILVIDDEEDICWLLSAILNKKGFNTIVAGTLEQGAYLIRDYSPQLVFLDINLPDGSGLKRIHDLKELSPSSKFILMSSYATEGETLKAIHDGAIGFLGKPLNIQRLQSLLEDSLNNKL